MPSLYDADVTQPAPSWTRAEKSTVPSSNGIGPDLRLKMYRMLVELREAEQRAYDLFLQNLVKGPSHLSLGQEAIATGFATAMEPVAARNPGGRQLAFRPAASGKHDGTEG